ncbi:LysR family transcriptional regulator [Aeromicrobium yanjiei]|uniref:LysR family transcriptional regulator n=1 Tax=Aeromicrobium yanjiei TaxID=2662028 RepID=A0A5Q2MJL8_9ACTN|nr:LysR family transcriptional regulator [Aeromicrobium yanjiei]QGG41256.1 LysR family transcriptional regulator [Aeromicrobium yanjiei]
METRELRYFVAVAEELHFGRAAQRLGMAQPPLSRAISQLERRLGAVLLLRDSRSVTLTPAGEVLLHESRVALDAVEAAEQRTRRAARSPDDAPSIVLATKAGASSELLAKLLHAYGIEPGSVRVQIELCAPGEQVQLLRTGRADVAILHRPFDDVSGFDVEELLTEGQVAVLPTAHALSARTGLSMSELTELSDLPLPRWPGSDGAYPDGPGPEVQSHSQLLQLISLGRTLMLAPDSCRSQLHDDLVAVPVVDAPGVTTVIAWPPGSRSQAVADLVRVALRL